MAIQMKAFMYVDKVSNDRMSFFINLNCLEFVFSFSCFFLLLFLEPLENRFVSPVVPCWQRTDLYQKLCRLLVWRAVFRKKYNGSFIVEKLSRQNLVTTVFLDDLFYL